MEDQRRARACAAVRGRRWGERRRVSHHGRLRLAPASGPDADCTCESEICGRSTQRLPGRVLLRDDSRRCRDSSARSVAGRAGRRRMSGDTPWKWRPPRLDAPIPAPSSARGTPLPGEPRALPRVPPASRPQRPGPSFRARTPPPASPPRHAPPPPPARHPRARRRVRVRRRMLARRAPRPARSTSALAFRAPVAFAPASGASSPPSRPRPSRRASRRRAGRPRAFANDARAPHPPPPRTPPARARLHRALLRDRGLALRDPDAALARLAAERERAAAAGRRRRRRRRPPLARSNRAPLARVAPRPPRVRGRGGGARRGGARRADAPRRRCRSGARRGKPREASPARTSP